MTDEALAALAEAATPGPWRVEHNGAGEYYLLAQQGPMTVSPAEAHGASDAAFIAAARDAVPSLLARVAKAEERAHALTAEVERLKAERDDALNKIWVLRNGGRWEDGSHE